MNVGLKVRDELQNRGTTTTTFVAPATNGKVTRYGCGMPQKAQGDEEDEEGDESDGEHRWR